MGRSGVACVLAALALGACGGRASLPSACVAATPADVLRALTAADGRSPVALQDGTPLSRCVEHAIDDADLQAIGATLTAAATALASRAANDEQAARRLGFLIGATQRGTNATAGLQGDLADRIAGAAAGVDGAQRAALLRGLALGRRSG